MGGRKTRLGAIIGAAIIITLPQLLGDVYLFRIVATALALVVVAGSALLISKKMSTPRKVAVPVIGTVGLMTFSYFIKNISDWRLSIFGFMILFVVYYLQDGIVGFVNNFYTRVFSSKKSTRDQIDVGNFDKDDAIISAKNSSRLACNTLSCLGNSKISARFSKSSSVSRILSIRASRRSNMP